MYTYGLPYQSNLGLITTIFLQDSISISLLASALDMVGAGTKQQAIDFLPFMKEHNSEHDGKQKDSAELVHLSGQEDLLPSFTSSSGSLNLNNA
jgi:hypothetical protein